MILSDIIQSQPVWDDNGIHCKDAEQYRLFHRFLREAVLDRHIPHYKAIGVSFMNVDKPIKRLRSLVNIEGNDSIGESYPELMLNLQDKVFISEVPTSKEVTVLNCAVNTGSNRLPGVPFVNASNAIMQEHVLYTRPDICVVMSDAAVLQVHCYYSCGYLDMSRTSRLVSKTVFPFYVDYSLQDFVRVLPPPRDGAETTVRVRFFNGMTRDIFITILRQWEESLKFIDFGTEEKLWLQKSEH